MGRDESRQNEGHSEGIRRWGCRRRRFESLLGLELRRQRWQLAGFGYVSFASFPPQPDLPLTNFPFRLLNSRRRGQRLSDGFHRQVSSPYKRYKRQREKETGWRCRDGSHVGTGFVSLHFNRGCPNMGTWNSSGLSSFLIECRNGLWTVMFYAIHTCLNSAVTSWCPIMVRLFLTSRLKLTLKVCGSLFLIRSERYYGEGSEEQG